MTAPLTPDELHQLAEWLHGGDLYELRDDLRARLERPDLNKVQHLIAADLAAIDDLISEQAWEESQERLAMGPGSTPLPSEHMPRRTP